MQVPVTHHQITAYTQTPLKHRTCESIDALISRPDVILVLPIGSNHTPHVHVQDLSPSDWDVHLIEFSTVMTLGQSPSSKRPRVHRAT